MQVFQLGGGRVERLIREKPIVIVRELLRESKTQLRCVARDSTGQFCQRCCIECNVHNYAAACPVRLAYKGSSCSCSCRGSRAIASAPNIASANTAPIAML